MENVKRTWFNLIKESVKQAENDLEKKGRLLEIRKEVSKITPKLFLNIEFL